jgi:putative transposase
MSVYYPTDLTDDQWELFCALLPTPKTSGRPRQVDLRWVVNAILYLCVAGCSWRMLPKDFPKWQTVYYYFRQWRMMGIWEHIHGTLVQIVRVNAGHDPAPSAASLDSQSVKIGSIPAALEVGYDGGKKIKGRKRHLMVDTLGLVMMVVVTSAHISDPQGAKLIFAKLRAWPNRMRRLVRIWVDGTYEGLVFMKWVMDTYRWILETVKRSDDCKGFVLLPKRWVVERTWGWLNYSRRLAKDYEALPINSETFIYIALIRIMLRRLA